MSAIDEVDVWHTGTDAELSALLGGAVGSTLDGHPAFKCVHAHIEQEGPIPTAEKADRIGEDGRPVINLGTGKPYQDTVTRPGRIRVRLNYKAS